MRKIMYSLFVFTLFITTQASQALDYSTISTNSKCLTSKDSYCTSTIEGYYIKNGEIIENDENCEVQRRELCFRCSDELIMVHSKCYNIDYIQCKTFVNKKCDECIEGTYKDEKGCVTIEGSKYELCTTNNLNNEGCYECKNDGKVYFPNYYH